MMKKQPSLTNITEIESPIEVLDIGANPIDGNPPYQPLLDAGVARVTGFEPNPDALARLNNIKGPNETYLGKAVYDGGEHELKVCMSQGMTSLLEPNTEILDYLHGFPQWGAVRERVRVPTVRLDDISEIERLDYLKIDVQGAELEIFRNGVERLRDCLVIQTEVEFLPMYENQPLFSEVEMFLREQGFLFHRFFPLTSRTIQPMIVSNDIYKGLSQDVWADAIFIRDFTKFDQLPPDTLKKVAIILHDVYGSCDVALRALMAHDTQSEDKLAEAYLTLLS